VRRVFRAKAEYSDPGPSDTSCWNAGRGQPDLGRGTRSRVVRRGCTRVNPPVFDPKPTFSLTLARVVPKSVRSVLERRLDRAGLEGTRCMPMPGH